MWRIVFTHRARKDLMLLDKDAASQIIKKLEKAAENPEKSFEKVTGFNYYKTRAGDYRAIAVLDFKLKIIEVRRAGHRKKIYKNL
ncbi:MAG: type II toxin-antitoxin system RelE/ParE family toxin [archaeon]|jgi:mRNA interferase RelE/StbE